MEKTILDLYNEFYNTSNFLIDRISKTISIEDKAGLIIEFVYLKNNVDNFFETFTKEQINNVGSKNNIPIYENLTEFKKITLRAFKELCNENNLEEKLNTIREPIILNTKNQKLNELSQDIYDLMFCSYKRYIMLDDIDYTKSSQMLDNIKNKAKEIKIKYGEEMFLKYEKETNWEIVSILDGILEAKSSLQEFEEKTNMVFKTIAICLMIFTIILLLIGAVNGDL